MSPSKSRVWAEGAVDPARPCVRESGTKKGHAAKCAKSAALLGMLLLVSTLSGFGCSGGGGDPTPLLVAAFDVSKMAVGGIGDLLTQEDSEKKIMVRVWVKADTEQNPLPEKSEIWLEGSSSWWIKGATKRGTGARNFGRRGVWRQRTIFIYPDGRGANQIQVRFHLTPDMKPKGSGRDVIRVIISDDEVVVSGSPIEAAAVSPRTGKFELRFKRFDP